MINGAPHYWCAICSQQLELIEDVVEATLREVRNFPHDSGYVQLERGESELPW